MENKEHPETPSTDESTQSKDGNGFRWTLTVVIILLALCLQFFLFFRFSLWTNKEGNQPTPLFKTPSPSESLKEGPPSPTEAMKNANTQTEGGNQGERSPGEDLIADAPPHAHFHGILELARQEERDLVLSRIQQVKLLEYCLKMKSSRDDTEQFKAGNKQLRRAFFSGLNRKQAKLVKDNMKKWDKETPAPAGEKSPEGVFLEQCSKALKGK